MLPPVRFLGKSEELIVLCRLGLDGRRVLSQLKGQIGQPLQIGVHLVPVNFLKEGFDALLVGGLVPGSPGLFRFLHQVFILQEGRPFHPTLLQVLVQIRADPALGGVNFQPSQDGQHLRLLLKSLSLLCVGVFIVGDDAAIQGGVADLPHSRGKGTPHHFKPSLPVICITDQGFCRGDHQQWDIRLVGECVVCGVVRCLIVPTNALVQNRVGDSLDHIPVIVRTAQAFRCQHGGVHHDKIGEMVEIVMPQQQLVFLGIVRRELQLFIPGDMRVAQ